MARLDKSIDQFDLDLMDEAMEIASQVTQEEYKSKYSDSSEYDYTAYYFRAGAMAAALKILQELYYGEQLHGEENEG